MINPPLARTRVLATRSVCDGNDLSPPDQLPLYPRTRPHPQSLVGERDHSSNVVNAVRAGFSTALGFMVVEAVLNLVVPAGWLWLDEQWKGRVVDGHPAGSSRGSSLVFGPSLNMDLLDSESQSGEFGDGRGVV